MRGLESVHFVSSRGGIVVEAGLGFRPVEEEEELEGAVWLGALEDGFNA